MSKNETLAKIVKMFGDPRLGKILSSNIFVWINIPRCPAGCVGCLLQIRRISFRIINPAAADKNN